jgi:hypothetical protein
MKPEPKFFKSLIIFSACSLSGDGSLVIICCNSVHLTEDFNRSPDRKICDPADPCVEMGLESDVKSTDHKALFA